ncbi:MAG: ribonuclease R family protein [Solirubrobacteraceae bacterium]
MTGVSKRPGSVTAARRSGLTADTPPALYVALLQRRGKFLVAEPFFKPGPRLAVSRDSRYGAGDLVAVTPGVTGRGGKSSRARVQRRIGRPDVARDVIEALMVDRGASRSFEPAVSREAAQVAARPRLAVNGRRDLRALPTFTIDPASAKDFDDAVSCEDADGGGWTVWVHIADVAAYVAPRSATDREAYRRGTSVYVPGAVAPMLPEDLSNGACSLVPGEDRLTVTTEMLLRDGEVVSAVFYRSVIRSDQRLSYERVDRIFDGSERAVGDWGRGLASARAAARALERKRSAHAALLLESEEPEFTFDRQGDVVRVKSVAQTESHRLVEHLMIAANEQVATFLESQNVPTLYRVHERPEPMAVERMLDQLASLGVPTPPTPDGPLTGQQAADVAGEASALVAQWLSKRAGRGARALNRIVLRSLKQAYYDAHNHGHSGLQLASYCHFTSPIRRYPDIICHRALMSLLVGDEPALDRSWVMQSGPWLSARERHAVSIERDADDIARCFLLARRLRTDAQKSSEEIFEGEIVGLIGAGAFVAFGEERQHEGLLPVRLLRDDWWELNEHGTALLGARRGGTLRLGDPIEVRVGSIDASRGNVDLLPVSEN